MQTIHMNTTIESRRVQWRMLTEGAQVSAPFGDHGWRACTVIGLGKNRGDNTVVRLAFETGGQGRRIAGELYWRKAELKGKDKPKPPAGESVIDDGMPTIVQEHFANGKRTIAHG